MANGGVSLFHNIAYLYILGDLNKIYGDAQIPILRIRVTRGTWTKDTRENVTTKINGKKLPHIVYANALSGVK